MSVPAWAKETAWQDCDGSRREADRLLIRPTSRSTGRRRQPRADKSTAKAPAAPDAAAGANETFGSCTWLPTPSLSAITQDRTASLTMGLAGPRGPEEDNVGGLPEEV